MDALFRVPHGFLRRHLSKIERGLVAAGLALVLYRLFASFPVYPSPWEVVAATAIFFVVLWSPAVGYFLAVVSALYPLYSVSLYLAVLFLAVALLGQRVFIQNMGATLLVLAAPWLAQYHLEWVPVLLGGLWWGKTGGAWMGGLAALWGMLVFGMSGQSPNWLDVMGFAPSSAGLLAQFQEANSLETLKLIVAPLAPNPTQTLYHLLQIVFWAGIAGEIGGLAESTWAQQKHPWRAMGITIISAVALAAVNIGLAAWLDQYTASDLSWIIPGMMESALYAAIAACVLEGARDFIEHPLPALRRSSSREEQLASQKPSTAQKPAAPLLQRLVTRLRALRPKHEAGGGNVPRSAKTSAASAHLVEVTQAADPTPGSAPYQPIPVPPDLPRRDSQKQPPDDIIKIELD